MGAVIVLDGAADEAAMVVVEYDGAGRLVSARDTCRLRGHVVRDPDLDDEYLDVSVAGSTRDANGSWWATVFPRHNPDAPDVRDLSVLVSDNYLPLAGRAFLLRTAP